MPLGRSIAWLRHAVSPEVLAAPLVSVLVVLVALFSIAAGTVAPPISDGLFRALLVLIGLSGLAGVADAWLKRVFDGFPTGLALSALWLVIVVFVAVFAAALPLAEATEPAKSLAEPALARPDLLSAHPLGTDRHGLDLLGGLAYGARVSLIVGIGAAAFSLLIGGTIGLVAGYMSGRVDRAVSLLSDSMLAFPPLILLLGLVSVVEPSIGTVTVGLAVLAVPGFIRMTRANTIAIAHRDFVLCAETLGATRRRILFRDILPNVLWPVLSYTIVVVGALIVAEASLSFLGLSVQRPNPTWGNMISAGQASYERHPHLVAVPAICMFVTVYALNNVGERVQSRFDAAPGQSAL